MTTIIITGNLTKDAITKTSKNGSDYVLLNIAENIFKRDNNGNILKDQNGYNQTLQTNYFTVFVNDKAGALSASKLAKGQTIKVVGKAKINIESDSNGYPINVIDSISAYSIDTDPYRNSEDDDNNNESSD